MPLSHANPDIRLATYGTLAPGRPNEHKLAGLTGVWAHGTVRGRLVEAGWGAELGYPGLILDREGDEIAVYLFESQDLVSYWPQLDAFEGPGYRRVKVCVSTPEGELAAYIYEIES